MRRLLPVALSALVLVGCSASNKPPSVDPTASSSASTYTFQVRSVVDTFPASASPLSKVGPGPLPSGVRSDSYQSLRVNCALPAAPTLASQQIIACDKLNQTVFVLGPAMITKADVASAIETPSGSGEGGSTVDVKLTDGGTIKFTALTTAASTQTTPQNQLAIVLGTQVVSAPSVEAPIPGGQLQIAGDLTDKEAQTIAGEIRP